jgi:PAS domain S-box-containing protein/prepilin-type N-terminal cleavage/methylation domain-containing protein
MATLLPGLAALFGHHFQIDQLLRFGPDLSPVMYNSALALVLLGTGLLARDTRWSKIAPLCAAAAGLISILTLLEYLLGVDLGIDQALQAQPKSAGVSDPGRMAPNAALCFVLLSLFLLTRPGALRSAALGLCLALETLLLGIVSVLGYALGITGAYGWGQSTRMSLLEALALSAIGAFLTASAWIRARDAGYDPRNWVPTLSFAAGLTIALSLWNGLRAQEETQIKWATQSACLQFKSDLSDEVHSRVLNMIRFEERWERSGRRPFDLVLPMAPGMRSIEWVEGDRPLRPQVASAVERRELAAVVAEGRELNFYVPVFRNDELDGFLVAVCELKDLLADPLRSLGPNFSARIREGGRELFSRPVDSPPGSDRYERQAVIQLMGLDWTIVVRPGARALAARTSLLPGSTLVIALLLAGLLSLSLHFAQRARTQADSAERARERLQNEVSERIKAETSLRQSEERYRDLFDHANDLIQCTAIDGRFIYVNPEWFRQLGYDPEEIDRLTLRDVLDPSSLRRWEEMVSLEKEDKFEVRFRTRDGRTLTAEGSCSIRYADGRPDAVRAIFRDVTDRRRIEELKSEFVSMVSHELRTPLTSIHGSLGLISGGAAGELPAQAGSLARIAYKNSERLIHLVNDILDLRRIEEGRVEFHLAPHDLAGIVQQAIEANRPYAEKFGVDMRLAESCDLLVFVDRDRLLQILANLLSNAVKFSPRGETVAISFSRHGRGARLAVTDRGPGIPEAFRPRVFQKFARAEPSGRREGSGLGLSISKAIVEKMRGQISFETRVGRGTTFFVDLPVCSSAEPGRTTGFLPATTSPEPPPNAGGFSLVEVIIVSALLAILLSVAYSLLREATRSADIGGVTSDVETRARVLLDFVKGELGFAKLNYLDIKPAGWRVRYQIPNRTTPFEWGYHDADGVFHAGWSAAIEFVPTRLLLEFNATASAPLPYHVYNFSLNLDDDFVDAFFVGKVVKRVYNHNLTPALIPVYEVTLCADDVLLAFPSLNGDVDGNGVGDPMLAFLNAQGLQDLISPGTTKMIHATLWLGNFDMDHRRFFMRRCDEIFRLRNTQ